jgi:hypothetical protein
MDTNNTHLEEEIATAVKQVVAAFTRLGDIMCHRALADCEEIAAADETIVDLLTKGELIRPPESVLHARLVRGAMDDFIKTLRTLCMYGDTNVNIDDNINDINVNNEGE